MVAVGGEGGILSEKCDKRQTILKPTAPGPALVGQAATDARTVF